MSKERFDAAAKEWDKNQTRVTLASKITSQIIKNIPLKNTHTVLDFGCGTGLVGLNIAPLVSKLIGVDISENMLFEFKNKASLMGLKNVEAIKTEEEFLPLSEKVDVAVSAMALHHIKELQKLFCTLGQCIKSGGYLAIADLAKEDGTFHADNTGVYHYGFEPRELELLFEGGGFSKPSISVAHTISKPHGDFDILFCFARKI